MSKDQLLDVNEAAERLRSHPETVRRLLRRGELIGLKMPSPNRGGKWKIRESSIELFLNGNQYEA
ncbi:helix-turn-helix domain-containing protein [Glutamicibacter ardleyensis]|uniref:Helix-turn-helix domain-containing protein n=1 Tax=Glutamicibacter ardleyensis TaxID=225894 RepID=A0ABQ2DTI4_9MICC|nr:helix-turn-helix domain-containing protein [Glutamicibacter ardleyensis]GGJ72832.1 hypothetical protein GCM10007173_34810 [Glutamicibacter ardleyensis]